MTERDVREALAEVLHEVRVGPFGPNALEVLNRGGVTHLNGSERDAATDAILASDVVARIRAEARAELTREERTNLSAIYGYEAGLADGRAEVVAAVRGALSNHPDACDRYDAEDVIKCGWKSAVIDVRAALAAVEAGER